LDPLAAKYALVPQSQFRAVKPYFTGSTYEVFFLKCMFSRRGFTFRQTQMYELTKFDVRNGQSIKFGLFKLFQKQKKVDTKKIAPAVGKLLYRPLELLYRPLQLLQRAVCYLSARWSLDWAVKCYFTAVQSRKNRHVKKKRGCQYHGENIYAPSLFQ
jgi:hypothetical protein